MLDFFRNTLSILTTFIILYIVLIRILKVQISDLLAPSAVKLSLDEKKDAGAAAEAEMNPEDLGDEMRNKLRKEFITDKLPPQLVQQAVYDPEYKQSIAPVNQDLYEKNADFGNEQTNVSQFFAANPGAFFNQQRHNAYVPDTVDWNKQGEQLYGNMVNAPTVEVSAYNNYVFKSCLGV